MKLNRLVAHMTQAFAIRQFAADQGSDDHVVFGYLGEPGVGKTAKIKEAAKLLSAEVRQMLGSALSPTDVVAMMPDVSEGMLVPMFNSEVPWADEVGDRKIVWFLDECTNFHPEVWKSFQKLIHERELFGRKLGPNVVIVMAGNRASDKASSTHLSTAVANRVTWQDWSYDNEEFIDYLLGRYDEAHEIAAYLSLKPLNAADFDTALKQMGKGSFVAWASPRSVERLALRMKFSDGNMTIDDMAGDIGMGRATEFYGFRKIVLELPPLSAILANPETVKLPEQTDRQYALTAMLVHNADRKNFGTLKVFVERLDMTLQILFLRMLSMRKSECTKTSEYVTWITQPQICNAIIGE